MKTIESDSNKNGNGRNFPDPHEDSFVEMSADGLQTALTVLKNRFPNSANVYNMAKNALRFPEVNIKAYSLFGDLSEWAIFVILCFREDYGQDITISPPLDFKETDAVRKAFVNTSAIDWRNKYIFCGIDRVISQMILSISTVEKKNGVVNNPNEYYYMDPEDAANLKIEERPGMIVKPLDTDKGLDFILKHWKFNKEGSREYTKGILEKGFSSGVYIDGNPVCAIIVNWNGILGMLYTAKEHRGKGYAKICTQHVMKQLGMNDYAVGSGVQCHNTASNILHTKLGMVHSNICDYIFFHNLSFEA